MTQRKIWGNDPIEDVVGEIGACRGEKKKNQSGLNGTKALHSLHHPLG